jgi:predicted DNA-binding protein with PD1-like motif
MQHTAMGEDHVLKLEKGEEVLESIVSFAKGHRITAASITGIGAVLDPVIGYYDLETKEYLREDLPGEYELVSLMGNIATKDGEPVLHAHVVLGAPGFVEAGHLFSATVLVTGEFVIRPLDGVLERRLDRDIGLPLLNLE